LAVCFPPFLRQTAIGKGQTGTPAADSAQVRRSRHAESLLTERASHVARSSEARTQELRRLCWFFADRAQEGGKQTGSVGRGNVRC
jgi:hypothetical protein